MYKITDYVQDKMEGDLAIPNGLIIPNTPAFMTNTDNMAFFFNYGLNAHFFCMNGIQ